MTTLKQQLLQEGFVTQINDDQLYFYHNKYKTTIKNPRNIPFETLVALLKTIRKLDKLRNPNISTTVDITINDDQSVFVQNKSDNYPIQTPIENLQDVLTNIYETHIRKEN